MTTRAPTIEEETRAAAGADFASSVAVDGPPPRPAGTWPTRVAFPWALLAIVVGLATLGACVLVPLREENRRLAHEFDAVRVEGDFVRRQLEANAAFLARVHSDPALAERLVMRATRRPASGKEFLDETPAGRFGSSPYAITQLAPPPPPPEYRSDLPVVLRSLFADHRSRAVLMAAGVFLVGASVILGRRNAECRVPNAE